MDPIVFLELDGDSMLALDSIEYFRKATTSEQYLAGAPEPETFIRTKSGLDVFTTKTAAEIKAAMVDAITHIFSD